MGYNALAGNLYADTVTVNPPKKEKIMKKIKMLSLFACLAMLLCQTAIFTACDTQSNEADTTEPTDTAESETQPPLTESEGLELYFDEDFKSYIVEGIGTCTDTEIVIPKTVNGYPVNWIAQNAFAENRHVTSVIIPEGVVHVGGKAFLGMTSLTSIVLPNSLEEIGRLAFIECPALASIVVGENNPIYHSDGNCLIETATKTLLVGCDNSVIPDDGSVTEIAYGAFASCQNLKSITIPGSVTKINESAFSSCKSLTSITIPDSVTEIGKSAFSHCTSLTEISISESIKVLERGMFLSCTSLESVSLPSGLTAIGSYAFLNCQSLKSIFIPAGVIEIENAAFGNCAALTSITVDKSNPSYYVRDNCLIERATKTLLVGGGDSVIPTDGSVTAIGGHAFSYRYKLSDLTVPDCITSIGDNAFANCENLTSVHIPDSVTSIGSNAFSHCDNLTSVHIPDSVTSIGSSAFSFCHDLKSVYISNSDIDLDGYVFSYSGNLESVTLPQSVTEIKEYTFHGCRSLKSVYYFGTAEEWARVTVAKNNNPLTQATVYFYSEDPPTDTANAYWHLVNGVPTAW